MTIIVCSEIIVSNLKCKMMPEIDSMQVDLELFHFYLWQSYTLEVPLKLLHNLNSASCWLLSFAGLCCSEHVLRQS